ncbi:MAG: 50S ribosomal protein L13 [Pseudomonadota bacterium]
MKTCKITAADIKQNWVVVDASGQTLGRLATEIARVLRGKHKPTYSPHMECGDHVVVVNAEKVRLTGKKMTDKIYYNHSTYIGGLKATRAEEMLAKHPDRVITFAVKGMLPKNTLGREMAKNLRVYAGTEHPHSGQKPVAMAARTAKGN